MIKDFYIDDIACRLYAPNIDSYPLVIFAHGFGSNYTELEHYGPRLNEADIGCLFFDFCGGGLQVKSKGSMWDMSVLTEIDDFEKVLVYGKTISSKIIVMGESQGGYVACSVASKHPEIAGCILWYPGFNIQDFCRRKQVEGYSDQNYLWNIPLGRKWIEDGLKDDIFLKMNDVKQKVLIFHGTKDRVVPIEYSIKSLDYLQATLIPVEDAHHGFNGDDRWKVISKCIEYIQNLN